MSYSTSFVRGFIVLMLLLLSACGGSDSEPETPGDAGKDKPTVTDYFAYVTQEDYTILQYRIGDDGALTPLDPASVATPGESPILSVHPSGRYAYVLNDDGIKPTISQYTIGSDGRLTEMTPVVELDSSGYGVAAVLHPGGQYFYVVNQYKNLTGGYVSQYTIGDDGRLSPASQQDPVDFGTSPDWITLDPLGRYAYVSDNNSVYQFTIGNENGELSAMSPASVDSRSNSRIDVHPSGNYAYGADFTSLVSQYNILGDGSLDSGQSITVAGRTQGVVFDPSGRYAYVYAYSNDFGGSGSISQFDVGSEGGLTAFRDHQPVDAGVSPIFMMVEPTGHYAYVVNTGNNGDDGEVGQYRIETDGHLTRLAPVLTGLYYPSSIAIAARVRQ